MDHVGKTREQKKREAVREFYEANAIRRKLQKDLHVKEPYSHNYYQTDSKLKRQMEALMRQLTTTYGADREHLGLCAYEYDACPHARAQFFPLVSVSKNQFADNLFAEKMMTLSQTENAVRDALHGKGEFIYVPKYYYNLVTAKDISFAHGSCPISTKTGSQRHYGFLKILNAREIKADWISDDNMKAFKVVAYPETSAELTEAVTGYVVRSTLSDDVGNSFGTDIHKAVSLCKRRTKKAVLEQMGV